MSLPSSTCGQYHGARVGGQGSDFNPRHPPGQGPLVLGISTQLNTGGLTPVTRRLETDREGDLESSLLKVWSLAC